MCAQAVLQGLQRAVDGLAQARGGLARGGGERDAQALGRRVGAAECDRLASLTESARVRRLHVIGPGAT